MATAISIGQTGLVASSKQMDVIGNNLANSSTVGFKASSTLFASMMNQGLSSSGTLSVGQGVAVASLPTQFSQGSFENTGNVTDMAIDGEGFFIVHDSGGAPLYTRAGAFHIDSNNNLADIRGYKVQGYSLTDAASSNVPTDIFLQKSKDATATTEISFGANLDESTAVDDTFEVSQNVYDSLGGSHTLSLIFTKTDTGWTVTGTFDGNVDPATGDVADPFEVGEVVFDETGKLDADTEDIEITIDALASGATIGDEGVLTWKLATDTNRTLTGYATESVVRSLYADGYAAGELRSLIIDNKGAISGVYTNGQTLGLFQVALANFQDQSALASSGNYYLETTASGQPTTNRASTGGLGNILANSLESSNTDVSKEFINMITAQRAYQASARIITTADQMLTELMNIKR